MSGTTIIVIVILLAMVGMSRGTATTFQLVIGGPKTNQKDWKMSKAPETCLYCHGTGEGPSSPCGFCENGKPLDTQEDWDNSWGKLFEMLFKPGENYKCPCNFPELCSRCKGSKK